MFWLNFLHFYQPPTASDEQVKEITKSCYQPWADFLLKNKKVKITLNITACLTERLFSLGYGKLLKQFATLARRGQIEFVESAAFHPILPLLPDKEIIKQIQINHDINSRRLGSSYQPRGFFPPEMAHNHRLAKIIKKLGYHYLLLDSLALPAKIGNHYHYQIKNNGLSVIFRDRSLSQTFVPESLMNIFSPQKNSASVIITATDGELYGHRHESWQDIYLQAINIPHLKTVTASEYLASSKITRPITPLTSSWETTPRELKLNQPFNLWANPQNKIHRLLWQLADFALQLNYQHSGDPHHFSSRLHLERGLASCTFWWASGHDFKLFGAPAWNPEEVEKGALELIRSVRTLTGISSLQKIKAERIFLKIHQAIWFTHWRTK
ncbi:MAG TPA: hypothetical protein PLR18_01310 [bacterium]|nr:hypothetical protein [bacterium]